MRNHKLLMVCLVLAGASVAGMTVWAADEANSAANIANNAANYATNAGNMAANMASNMASNAANMASNMAANTGNTSSDSNVASNAGPGMRFREVNNQLTQALQALDDAKAAENNGDKTAVLNKIADAKQRIQNVQDSMNSWTHNRFSGRTGDNAASNMETNAPTNAPSNTP